MFENCLMAWKLEFGPISCSHLGPELEFGPIFCSHLGPELEFGPIFCSHLGPELEFGPIFCSHLGPETLPEHTGSQCLRAVSAFFDI
jgi:hypothetical protein